jgi:hypothetical protein
VSLRVNALTSEISRILDYFDGHSSLGHCSIANPFCRKVRCILVSRIYTLNSVFKVLLNVVPIVPVGFYIFFQ